MKRAMQVALVEDEKRRSAGSTVLESFASALCNRNVWMSGGVYFSIQMGVYAINFWQPSIIKSLGFQSPGMIGWLSAIPSLDIT